MSIERYYDASKNPDRAALGGVPLGDLDTATWEGLTPHQQRSVDATGFYRKTRPSSPAPASDVAASKPKAAKKPQPAPVTRPTTSGKPAPAPGPAVPPSVPSPQPAPAADAGSQE